jgi:hypothetical protein
MGCVVAFVTWGLRVCRSNRISLISFAGLEENEPDGEDEEDNEHEHDNEHDDDDDWGGEGVTGYFCVFGPRSE